MSSRREVRWGETEDHDHQGRSAYGENEVNQCTRDEAMFPEIVECAKGVEILEGEQRDVNVGDIKYLVVSASSSSGSVQSAGGKKPRGPSHSIQGQQSLKPPSQTGTPGVLLKRYIVCHRCGQPGHIRAQCPRCQRSCFTCGKLDHFARNCPQIISQPQPPNTQRQRTVRVSASPGNFRSQERKRQREPNQPSQNQINLGPPNLFGNRGVSQLDKLCYVCRKPGHFARNCPQGSGVYGESSSVQQDKRIPKRHQMQFRH